MRDYTFANQPPHGLPRRATVAFQDVERAWNTLFIGPESESIAGIDTAVCGEENAMLYRGSLVDCEALIAIAREQVLSMSAICALTDRYSPMYFVLRPPHELLYIRHIFARFPEQSAPFLVEKPLFVAIVGTRQSVFVVSGRLDAMIDRALIAAVE